MQVVVTAYPGKHSGRLQSPMVSHAPATSSTVCQGSEESEIGDEDLPTVFIVSDDSKVREALDQNTQAAAWRILKFHSIQSFFAAESILTPCCLVLDLALPGLDGIDLHERLAADRPGLPIVLVNGVAGAPVTLVASTTEKAQLFTRGTSDVSLAKLVSNALERSQRVFDRWTRVRHLIKRYDDLSRREREVMALIVSGWQNKVAAYELGISEVTVKAHRASVMRKMRAQSLPGLVHMAICLGISAVGDF